ncbi:MAG: DUF3486 family protein, partial [Candidatus Binataceae bacterium]
WLNIPTDPQISRHMPRRSKVITLLPEELRKELDDRLIKGSSSDYLGLEAWLRRRGFQISRASINRYGHDLEQRAQTIALATRQARAITEATPDDEIAMGDALVRLVQERIFAVLVDSDLLLESGKLDMADLSRLSTAIGELDHVTITQRRWASETRGRLEEQKKSADKEIAKLTQSRGLSHDAADKIRTCLLEIDPLRDSHSSPAGATLCGDGQESRDEIEVAINQVRGASPPI